MSVHAKKLEISTQNLDFLGKKNSCQMTLIRYKLASKFYFAFEYHIRLTLEHDNQDTVMISA